MSVPSAVSVHYCQRSLPMSGRTTNCDSSHGYSLIPELHQHAGHHVVEVVAVERPSSWIVGVECDTDADHHRCDPHGVADGALNRPAIDRDHLKRVAVQMDRM